MEDVLGTSLLVFVAVTVVIMGGAACLTGQALAATWRPLPHLFFYGFLLGLTDRFLVWSLFQGQLLSLSGFLIDTLLITGFAFVAYRITRVSKMVSQYPWLYEREGLWRYRAKQAPPHAAD
ncbi:MAG: hypothetical protein HYW28_10815 [Rhodospirillales bacterium]|nr:hypothetical protein [Rhodospirillales bacterium]MBI2977850.1 hypothetical protein [Rhodospirillales bacterium]